MGRSETARGDWLVPISGLFVAAGRYRRDRGLPVDGNGRRSAGRYPGGRLAFCRFLGSVVLGAGWGYERLPWLGVGFSLAALIGTVLLVDLDRRQAALASSQHLSGEGAKS